MIADCMHRLYQEIGPYTLVSGMQGSVGLGSEPRTGADAMSVWTARTFLYIPVEEHHAEWRKHGKAAGPMRNEEMAKSQPDYAMGFIVNPNSMGSEHMLLMCKKYKIPWMVKRVGSYASLQFPKNGFM
jgi:hypothetical protein